MSPTELKRSSAVRGLLITLCVAGYAFVFKRPEASLTSAFLVGAVLQIAALAVRRMVPPKYAPQAMYALDLVVDGLTVLLFAVGVYGGILHGPDGL